MDETGRLTKKREAEKYVLQLSVADFEIEMLTRLFQKVDEGYGGWERKDWDILSHIRGVLLKAEQSIDGEDRKRRAVDIANFAFMVWFRELEQQP